MRQYTVFLLRAEISLYAFHFVNSYFDASSVIHVFDDLDSVINVFKDVTTKNGPTLFLPFDCYQESDRIQQQRCSFVFCGVVGYGRCIPIKNFHGQGSRKGPIPFSPMGLPGLVSLVEGNPFNLLWLSRSFAQLQCFHVYLARCNKLRGQFLVFLYRPCTYCFHCISPPTTCGNIPTM